MFKHRTLLIVLSGVLLLVVVAGIVFHKQPLAQKTIVSCGDDQRLSILRGDLLRYRSEHSMQPESSAEATLDDVSHGVHSISCHDELTVKLYSW